MQKVIAETMQINNILKMDIRQDFYNLIFEPEWKLNICCYLKNESNYYLKIKDLNRNQYFQVAKSIWNC